jgi:hypothetical protein
MIVIICCINLINRPSGSRLLSHLSCDHVSDNRGRHYILHMVDICHMAGLKEPSWMPICYLVVINCSHLII